MQPSMSSLSLSSFLMQQNICSPKGNCRVGENISPYYYHIPKFRTPLLKNDIYQDIFKEVYKYGDNENPLPPRGVAISPDVIHIELARYIELFGITEYSGNGGDSQKLYGSGLVDIGLSKLVDMITEDIQEELGGKVDVTYDIVRNRYNDMRKKNIIYPGLGLDMRKFDYVLAFCWIKSNEIYQTMKTFAHFNVVTALAFTKDDRYLLHLQYPGDEEIEIRKCLVF